MLKLSGLVASFILAFCTAIPAQAQFVGDVYFLQPSIAIPSGQAGTLDLAIFTGDRPFGATLVTLTFDPAKVNVVSIAEGANGDDSLRLESLNDNGTLRIVALNTATLERPIGSVRIARLQVRVTGSPGERIAIRSAVSRALFADRSAMRAGTGFDAEIIVGQASVAASGPVMLVGNQSPLGDRARRLRPAGSEVRLVTKLNNGTIGEVRVRTSGAATLRD